MEGARSTVLRAGPSSNERGGRSDEAKGMSLTVTQMKSKHAAGSIYIDASYWKPLYSATTTIADTSVATSATLTLPTFLPSALFWAVPPCTTV